MKPFYRLNKNSRYFLSKWYLIEWQSAEERISEISKTAENILWIDWFADKFYEYISKWYYSLSTPVWNNFWNNRWLPISCFGSYINDTMGSILYTSAEVWMMSKLWWGTSGFFWNLRPRWSWIKNNWKSSWAVHFMKLFESMIDVSNQWASRRWAFTPYLPLEHDDIEEFLEIGTEWNPIQKCTTWVTVTDWWLESMKNWDKDKRKTRAKVLQRRSEVWYPYIAFKDNINNQSPDVYKDKWLEITHQNLCAEIALSDSKDKSFVCCLSSINLLHRDEIKNTDAVETMIYFLDAVMQEFIDKLEARRDSEDSEDNEKFEFMKRAYNFAKEERALWLWVLGWHSHLQSKMIPFESEYANLLNKDIFQTIQSKSFQASKELATMYWEPELLKWYWRRNSCVNAIAPTTSSAFILWQVSQSIEPWFSNYVVKDLAKWKVTLKNKFLKDLLDKYEMNTDEVRESIMNNDGSVQHLEFLTDNERDVFKTFREIDQYAIINQAADRQVYIDQWQSLNLLVDPKTPTKEINSLYLYAWEKGIKSLYYQHSVSAAQELWRKNKRVECSWETCTVCQA